MKIVLDSINIALSLTIREIVSESNFKKERDLYEVNEVNM
jgi:hypothetical protein